MGGQAPWQNGRRAWERLGGYYEAGPGLADLTDEQRTHHHAQLRHDLADLRLVRGLLSQAELGLVRRARDAGFDWNGIAGILDMSRAEAFDRWHAEGEPPPT